MSGTPRRAVLIAVVVLVAAAAGAGWVLVRSDRQAPAETTLEALGVHGHVPDFQLTDQHGRPVGRDALAGAVSVVDFIYTDCTESCPTQSLEMARVASDFPAVTDLQLVSITVDPEHDRPDVLRAYAERHGADGRWLFLTGDTREIYCLAREGFRLGVVDPAAPAPVACGARARWWPGPAAAWAHHGPPERVVMHSARVVLVDRDTRIRAYHLATDPGSMRRLRDNVRRLLAEPPR